MKRDITLAWQIAAFNRNKAKKLPDLNSLLTRIGVGAQERQTAAQQQMVLHMLSAQLGAPLRRVRLIHTEAHGQ